MIYRLEVGKRDMAMNDYILESKGRCFFCLIEVLPQVKLEPGLASRSSSSSVYSLQRLSRFLQIDLKKVLEKKWPISSYHPWEKEVKVKVELCEECAALIGTFSKLHRQLEQIEMEVKSCVSRIHLKLVEAEETGMTVHFGNLMTDSEFVGGDGDLKQEIVEALRAEAIERCVHKLGIAPPQDRIPNLIKKTTASMSAHPVGAPSKSRKLVGPHQFTIDPDTGKYRCNICSKELKNRPTFRSHYKSSHLRTKYQCTLCDKEFGRKDIYTKHHRTFHGGVFKCELCSEVFTRKLLLKQHRRKKHNTNAPVDALGGVEDLEMEMKEDPDTFENSNVEEDENFDWDYSEMETEETKIEVETAAAEEEANRNKVQCNICHLQVIDLTSHLSAVHFEAEGTLERSEEEATRSGIQESHLDILNLSGPQFKCKSGDSNRSKGKEKITHIDEMTKLETNDDGDGTNPTTTSSVDVQKLPMIILNPAKSTEVDGTPQPQTTLNPETGRLKCNICLQEFKHNSSFQSHYKSAHLKVRFKCTLCGKQFRRRDNYLNHNQSVHMGVRFRCNICIKSFSQKSFLKKHQQTVHSQPREPVTTETSFEIPQSTINPETGAFKCNLCPKEFKEEPYYQQHYKSIHLKVRYLCPVCRKDFPRKTHLRRHHQSVHLGVRFKCEGCEKSFSLGYHLRLHQRTTTCGGRSVSELEPLPKHVCHLCGKDFSRKTSLQKHLETVHMNLRKHLCELCGKKFKTKTHLNTHRQGVHKGA